MFPKLDLTDYALTLFNPEFEESLKSPPSPVQASDKKEDAAQHQPSRPPLAKSTVELQLRGMNTEKSASLSEPVKEASISLKPADVLDKDGNPLWKKFNYEDRLRHLEETRKRYLSYEPPLNLYKTGKRITSKVVNEGIIPNVGSSVAYGIANFAASHVASALGGPAWMSKDSAGNILSSKKLSHVASRIASEVTYYGAHKAVAATMEELQIRHLPDVKIALQYQAMHQEIVAETADYVKILPEPIKKTIDKLDQAITYQIEDYIEDPEESFSSRTTYGLLKRRELALSAFIPETERFPDPEKKKQLKQELYQFADDHFEPDTASKVKDRFDTILDGRDRPNMGFEGLGGTFKTLTPLTLSKILDCPLMDRYTLDKLGDAHFLGSDNSKLLDLTSPMESFLGEFTMDVINTRNRSGIKFIVNLDDMRNLSGPYNDVKLENFKKIMNPLLACIKSMAMGGIDINIKDVLFYSSTNHLVQDGNLRGRLGLISPVVSDKKRREKMDSIINDGLKKAAEDNATEADPAKHYPVEKIAEKMQAFYEYILDCDKKLNPGERNIGEVTRYAFSHIKREIDGEISEFQMKRRILKNFDELLGQHQTRDQYYGMNDMIDDLYQAFPAEAAEAKSRHPREYTSAPMPEVSGAVYGRTSRREIVATDMADDDSDVEDDASYAGSSVSGDKN